MKKLFSILVMILFINLLYCQTIYAQNTCVVNDPTDTPLATRTEPMGNIIGSLPNGLKVDVTENWYDEKGDGWARVSGFYRGIYQDLGWVYKPHLNCLETVVTPEK